MADQDYPEGSATLPQPDPDDATGATSPAGDAATLPGTGDGGAAGAGAVSAVPPPDPARQGRIRARLRRRISRPAEPSDVDVIKQRLAQERDDDWIVLTTDEQERDAG